jgi:large subunit ribosomal protein L21
MLEKLIPTDADQTEPEVGQQIIFDKVLIVGTEDYTSIGRPSVPHARVYATLEEKTKSEKVIIFKKKRRKGY